MGWHGVGSISSPIVISDDEDETLVERALEGRLSDPYSVSGTLEFDYGEDEDDDKIPLSPTSNIEFLPEVTQPIELSPELDKSKKRKRKDEAPNALPPQHAIQVAIGPTSQKKMKLQQPQQKQQQKSDGPAGESKTARKKRRKRERQEAEATATTAAATHAQLPPRPASPPLLSLPTLSRADTLGVPIPRKSSPKPRMSVNLIPLGPPRSLSSHNNLHLAERPEFLATFSSGPFSHDQDSDFSAHPLPLQASQMTSLPPCPSFLPPPPVMDPITFMLQATLLQNMQNILAPGIERLDIESPDVFYEPQPNSSGQPSQLPRNVVRKIVGMTADLDDAKAHGIFTSKSYPSPSHDRSLVLELLPKRFRTTDFVRKWAKRFGGVSHVEVDSRNGKSLVIFGDAKTAREAWASPRLPAGDGREHIRAYWYRTPGAEFEEGEIEEWELEDIEKLKEKASHVKPPPPPASGSGKPKGNVKGKRGTSSDSTSNLSIQPGRLPFADPPPLGPHSTSTSPSFAPPPTAPAPPLPPPPLSHTPPPPAELVEVENESNLDAEPTPAPQTPSEVTIEDYTSVPSLKAASSTPLVIIKTPAQTLAAANAVFGLQMAEPPPQVIVTLPKQTDIVAQPSVLPPLVEPRLVRSDSIKQSLLTRQKELEKRIARSRLEIAARSNSSRSEVEAVDPTPITMPQKSEPGSSGVAVSPTDEPVATVLSPEERLRQLARASVKAKPSNLMDSGSVTPVTPSSDGLPAQASSVPNITPEPSSMSLDLDFAASFITETIQSVVPTLPPALPKISEKESLAIKQAALEKHIAETKRLMAKLSVVKTKAEKDVIMAELRASSRRAEESMKSYSSPVMAYQEVKRLRLPPHRPSWPIPQDSFILLISDDEDEDEDEEDEY